MFTYSDNQLTVCILVACKGIKPWTPISTCQELRANALQILGSMDFLGNPMGLLQDVREGVEGLVHDQNPAGLVKGILHGFSNSSAKVLLGWKLGCEGYGTIGLKAWLLGL